MSNYQISAAEKDQLPPTIVQVRVADLETLDKREEHRTAQNVNLASSTHSTSHT